MKSFKFLKLLEIESEIYLFLMGKIWMSLFRKRIIRPQVTRIKFQPRFFLRLTDLFFFWITSKLEKVRVVMDGSEEGSFVKLG